MTPYQLEQCEILRRIAQRGKRVVEYRQEKYPEEGRYLDLFVHLLDEIQRLKDSQNRAQDEVRAREETYA